MTLQLQTDLNSQALQKQARLTEVSTRSNFSFRLLPRIKRDKSQTEVREEKASKRRAMYMYMSCAWYYGDISFQRR